MDAVITPHPFQHSSSLNYLLSFTANLFSDTVSIKKTLKKD